MTANELWAIARPELMRNLPVLLASYLAGSQLEEGGEVDVGTLRVPVYRIIVNERAGVGWLSVQAAFAICRTLSSLVGKRVDVEIVCVESEEVS